MILCVGKSENFEFAVPIGIGLLDSAITLTKVCMSKKPEIFLFIGSAGSYGKYKIFDIVESNKAAQVELSYLESNSYTPINNTIESLPIGVSHGTFRSIVNSSNYITTNSKLAKIFLELSLEIENMEFFSVMSVAKHFKIPAMGIFVVTNYCDENAHSTFLKNHKKAKSMLAEYLKNRVNSDTFLKLTSTL